MQNYARVEDGLVMEVFRTDQPIGALFHPGLTWVRVPDDEAVAPGWGFDGKVFGPPASQPHAGEAPSLASIMTELAAIQAELASLKKG